jgi:hypothetical protein
MEAHHLRLLDKSIEQKCYVAKAQEDFRRAREFLRSSKGEAGRTRIRRANKDGAHRWIVKHRRNSATRSLLVPARKR